MLFIENFLFQQKLHSPNKTPKQALPLNQAPNFHLIWKSTVKSIQKTDRKVSFGQILLTLNLNRNKQKSSNHPHTLILFVYAGFCEISMQKFFLVKLRKSPTEICRLKLLFQEVFPLDSHALHHLQEHRAFELLVEVYEFLVAFEIEG